MDIWLAVALGGAAGACGRYGIFLGMRALVGPLWPAGTLVANLLGSFVLAYLGTRAGRDGAPSGAALSFWTTGFCGAFTTYSTFNLEVLTLAQVRGPGVAGGYLLVTVVLALGAGWAGLRAGAG